MTEPIYIDDNILYPPFTAEKCKAFAKYADSENKRIEQHFGNRYALAYNEIMGEKEVEIIVPEYDPETGEQTGEHTEIITIPYPVINPDYEKEQAEARQEEFLKEFFNTSLGYIRRSVTMANGEHKDFLSDLLPVISMGVQAGQAVNIITYNMPDFSEPVEDWTQYQTVKAVTPQFIQECFIQLSNDFIPNLEN